MVELTVQAVLWCAQHGHPVLELRTQTGDRQFAVAIAAEDAGAMAVWRGGASGQTRFCDLFERALTGLGAKPTAVALSLGPEMALRAVLQLSGQQGSVDLPLYFADGLILAQRHDLPLRMAETDLAQVSASPGGPTEGDRADNRPPAPFRQVIASLDLDGMTREDASRRA